MIAQPKFSEKLTVEEYIKLEEENRQKNEYHDGYIHSLEAMAGGSVSHSTISSNLLVEIGIELKGKPCKPINSDMKLWMRQRNSYVYPDGVIVCGDFQVAENHKDAITNPAVIFEVLSKSMAGYDRGDKFFMYRQIPSLLHYVLIEQDKPQVEVFSRKEDPNKLQNSYLWKIITLEGLDKRLTLELPNDQKVEVSLKDIYEGVDFEK